MAVKTKKTATPAKTVGPSKPDFVSLVSHQLRAPLTGIMWTAELFSEKEKLTESGKKYLNDIIVSAKRMDRLVKLLLNVSRIDSARVGVAPKPVDLVEFINERARSKQDICKQKGLTLTFVKHSQKFTATTDKDLLDYITQTVLENALDYTSKGGKIEMALEQKKNSTILLVKDTGIGIPKKEQPRIFEKFFRASNASAAKPSGAGLGLYIASEAAKLLGGKVWFESQEGKGSSFCVEISLAAKSRAGEKKLVVV